MFFTPWGNSMTQKELVEYLKKKNNLSESKTKLKVYSAVFAVCLIMALLLKFSG